MHIQIDFANVEELIFNDRAIARKLNSLKPIFDEWAIAKRSPRLSHIVQKAKLRMLQEINNEHLLVLEDHWGATVRTVSPLLDKVQNFSGSIDDLQCFLMDYRSNADNVCVSRNREASYITFWR